MNEKFRWEIAVNETVEWSESPARGTPYLATSSRKSFFFDVFNDRRGIINLDFYWWDVETLRNFTTSQIVGSAFNLQLSSSNTLRLTQPQDPRKFIDKVSPTASSPSLNLMLRDILRNFFIALVAPKIYCSLIKFGEVICAFLTFHSGYLTSSCSSTSIQQARLRRSLRFCQLNKQTKAWGVE